MEESLILIEVYALFRLTYLDIKNKAGFLTLYPFWDFLAFFSSKTTKSILFYLKLLVVDKSHQMLIS